MYFSSSFFEYLENTFVFQIAKAAKAAKADFKRGGQGGEDLGLEVRIILFPKTPEGSNHHLNFSVYSFEVSKLMKLDMDDSYNLFLF